MSAIASERGIGGDNGVELCILVDERDAVRVSGLCAGVSSDNQDIAIPKRGNDVTD